MKKTIILFPLMTIITLYACAPMLTALPATRPSTETTITTPSETQALEPNIQILPTLLPQQPDSGIWADVPMYALVSTPPVFLFQVQFDTSRWQLIMNSTDATSNQYSLEHRIVQGCNIEKTVGRGLPPDWTVKKIVRVLGNAQYGIVYVSDQHQLRFINYCTGVGENSETCFAINVQANQQECIDDGEKVIGTFTVIKNPYLKSP